MAVVMVQTGLCQRRGLLVAFARKAPTCVGCRFLASRAFVHSGPVTTACGMADLHCPLVVASPWEIEVCQSSAPSSVCLATHSAGSRGHCSCLPGAGRLAGPLLTDLLTCYMAGWVRTEAP